MRTLYPDGITVMLVDGSATLRYYNAILLQRLGFRVIIAESAREALTFMENGLPSIILTDMALPDMNGAAFIRTLKNAEGALMMPVIALTDREDRELRSACLDLGCSDCLIKHVEPGQLYQAIHKTLSPAPRAHIRLSLPLKVVVGDGTSQGGAERTEYTTTISEGGMYLRTLFPRPRDSCAPVTLFIRNRAVRTKAKVIYSRTMEGGLFREPGMGMKFLEISPEDRHLVRHFIKEQLTSDIVIGL